MRFYKSRCLPNLFLSLFSGKNWIFEIKWDGFRAIAYLDYYFTLRAATLRNLNAFSRIRGTKAVNKNVVLDAKSSPLKMVKSIFIP